MILRQTYFMETYTKTEIITSLNLLEYIFTIFLAYYNETRRNVYE